MSKNIVICCDGTDNKLSIGENTNVIHLYSCLIQNSGQIAYYNPGVGTITHKNLGSKIQSDWYKLMDKLSAKSLHGNVTSAYQYLMEYYEDGDKIFLFGFSRGAYTVRMLAGMIRMFGLLQKGNIVHLRYILEVYSTGDKMFHTANSFKKRFSRKVDIQFMGIWDTVVSMGGLIDCYKSFPYSRSLENVLTVRHALALDERRKHFYWYPVKETHKDLLEVCFPGVHSDIGGGYEEQSLAKLSLNWIIREARVKGLEFNESRVKEYVLGSNKYVGPDPLGFMHNSFKGLAMLSDLIPRLRYSSEAKFQFKVDYRFKPYRTVMPHMLVHKSVIERMKKIPIYKPANLPESYVVIE